MIEFQDVPRTRRLVRNTTTPGPNGPADPGIKQREYRPRGSGPRVLQRPELARVPPGTLTYSSGLGHVKSEGNTWYKTWAGRCLAEVLRPQREPDQVKPRDSTPRGLCRIPKPQALLPTDSNVLPPQASQETPAEGAGLRPPPTPPGQRGKNKDQVG